VFSTIEKLEFIRYARRQGYEIYTTYVTTNSPEINIARVKERVKHGGHDVPQDKIISRYEKSMALMSEVFYESDTVEFYDNSGTSPVYIAKKSPHDELLIFEELPEWFNKYIVSKIDIALEN
jgi:predicted ABC-type ATPase